MDAAIDIESLFSSVHQSSTPGQTNVTIHAADGCDQDIFYMFEDPTSGQFYLTNSLNSVVSADSGTTGVCRNDSECVTLTTNTPHDNNFISMMSQGEVPSDKLVTGDTSQPDTANRLLQYLSSGKQFLSNETTTLHGDTRRSVLLTSADGRLIGQGLGVSEQMVSNKEENSLLSRISDKEFSTSVDDFHSDLKHLDWVSSSVKHTKRAPTTLMTPCVVSTSLVRQHSCRTENIDKQVFTKGNRVSRLRSKAKLGSSSDPERKPSVSRKSKRGKNVRCKSPVVRARKKRCTKYDRHGQSESLSQKLKPPEPESSDVSRIQWPKSKAYREFTLPSNYRQVSYGYVSLSAFIKNDEPWLSVPELMQKGIVPLNRQQFDTFVRAQKLKVISATEDELYVLKHLRAVAWQTRNLQMVACKDLKKLTRYCIDVRGFKSRDIREVNKNNVEIHHIDVDPSQLGQGSVRLNSNILQSSDSRLHLRFFPKMPGLSVQIPDTSQKCDNSQEAVQVNIGIAKTGREPINKKVTWCSCCEHSEKFPVHTGMNRINSSDEENCIRPTRKLKPVIKLDKPLPAGKFTVSDPKILQNILLSLGNSDTKGLLQCPSGRCNNNLGTVASGNKDVAMKMGNQHDILQTTMEKVFGQNVDITEGSPNFCTNQQLTNLSTSISSNMSGEYSLRATAAGTEMINHSVQQSPNLGAIPTFSLGSLVPEQVSSLLTDMSCNLSSSTGAPGRSAEAGMMPKAAPFTTPKRDSCVPYHPFEGTVEKSLQGVGNFLAPSVKDCPGRNPIGSTQDTTVPKEKLCLHHVNSELVQTQHLSVDRSNPGYLEDVWDSPDLAKRSGQCIANDNQPVTVSEQLQSPLASTPSKYVGQESLVHPYTHLLESPERSHQNEEGQVCSSVEKCTRFLTIADKHSVCGLHHESKFIPCVQEESFEKQTEPKTSGNWLTEMIQNNYSSATCGHLTATEDTSHNQHSIMYGGSKQENTGVHNRPLQDKPSSQVVITSERSQTEGTNLQNLLVAGKNDASKTHTKSLTRPKPDNREGRYVNVMEQSMRCDISEKALVDSTSELSSSFGCKYLKDIETANVQPKAVEGTAVFGVVTQPTSTSTRDYNTSLQTAVSFPSDVNVSSTQCPLTHSHCDPKVMPPSPDTANMCGEDKISRIQANERCGSDQGLCLDVRRLPPSSDSHLPDCTFRHSDSLSSPPLHVLAETDVDTRRQHESGTRMSVDTEKLLESRLPQVVMLDSGKIHLQLTLRKTVENGSNGFKETKVRQIAYRFGHLLLQKVKAGKISCTNSTLGRDTDGVCLSDSNVQCTSLDKLCSERDIAFESSCREKRRAHTSQSVSQGKDPVHRSCVRSQQNGIQTRHMMDQTYRNSLCLTDSNSVKVKDPVQHGLSGVGCSGLTNTNTSKKKRGVKQDRSNIPSLRVTRRSKLKSLKTTNSKHRLRCRFGCAV